MFHLWLHHELKIQFSEKKDGFAVGVWYIVYISIQRKKQKTYSHTKKDNWSLKPLFLQVNKVIWLYSHRVNTFLHIYTYELAPHHKSYLFSYNLWWGRLSTLGFLNITLLNQSISYIVGKMTMKITFSSLIIT